MQDLKATPEDTSSYLSKEDLKTLLTSKQDKIKKLVGEVKHYKSITLSATLNGEYMISSTRKRLTSRKYRTLELFLHCKSREG